LDHIPLGVDRVDSPASHCAHVSAARRGTPYWAAEGDITCPLARFNLGLDPPDDAVLDRLVDQLLAWEFTDDRAAARFFLSGLLPLPHGDPILVYGPPAALPREPDVTIHVVGPEEAMKRILERARSRGVRALGDMGGLGAVCGECTAFPLHSGRSCVSVGCPGSRRALALAPTELLLAEPRTHQHELTLDVA
jgi:uncharacterized protein (DUF169 family)